LTSTNNSRVHKFIAGLPEFAAGIAVDAGRAVRERCFESEPDADKTAPLCSKRDSFIWMTRPAFVKTIMKLLAVLAVDLSVESRTGFKEAILGNRTLIAMTSLGMPVLIATLTWMASGIPLMRGIAAALFVAVIVVAIVALYIPALNRSK
jgi:hypothetical protein